MAKKTTAKPKTAVTAIPAMADHGKKAAPKPKTTAAKKPAAVAKKPSMAKAASPRKSIARKAVDAVTSTVSTVADQATSIFRRGRTEKT